MADNKKFVIVPAGQEAKYGIVTIYGEEINVIESTYILSITQSLIFVNTFFYFKYFFLASFKVRLNASLWLSVIL